MARGGLPEQLAASIETWLAEERLPAGTPLPERAVAERFRVSRSPVREALLLLAGRQVIAPRPEGGYAVGSFVAAAPALALPPADEDESTYLRIAEDRLEGRLPERLTENELMRRYDVTRARLAAVLRRITHEGWIERLPGNGWQFLPTLTSADSYDQAYRFRILNEPAALLEPTYALDEPALRRCLAEQQALIAGAVETVSAAQLFDANTRLHETITGFSGNVFIVDALRRINRLRRLVEYRKTVDRQAAAKRCHEHTALIEMLLDGRREMAADFLRLHLRDAAHEKSHAGQWPGAAGSGE